MRMLKKIMVFPYPFQLTRYILLTTYKPEFTKILSEQPSNKPSNKDLIHTNFPCCINNHDAVSCLLLTIHSYAYQHGHGHETLLICIGQQKYMQFIQLPQMYFAKFGHHFQDFN